MRDFANEVSQSRNDDLRIRGRLREVIGAVAGDDLTGLLLFGSKARGDAHKDSDWDVAVLVRDEADYRDIGRRIAIEIAHDEVLWNCVVQPVVLRPSDMAGAWGLVRNLEAEAIPL